MFSELVEAVDTQHTQREEKHSKKIKHLTKGIKGTIIYSLYCHIKIHQAKEKCDK